MKCIYIDIHFKMFFVVAGRNIQTLQCIIESVHNSHFLLIIEFNVFNTYYFSLSESDGTIPTATQRVH